MSWVMGYHLSPISDMLKSFTNQLSNFLNSGIFNSLLGGLTDVAGSAGVQLAGTVTAISSISSGDKKEKLLGMIFLELQLLYIQLKLLPQQLSLLLNNPISGFALGGLVRGPGTSTSDDIPAMLSNGEAVLNAKAVKRLGVNFINSVNNGDFAKIKTKFPKFAYGGVLSSAKQETARGVTDFSSSIGTNVSTQNYTNIALVRDEREAMEHFMKSPQGQRILVDFTKKSAQVYSMFSN